MKTTSRPAKRAAVNRTSRSILARRARLDFREHLRHDPALAVLRSELLAEWLTLQARKYGDRITVRYDARGDLHFYAPDLFEIKHAKSEIGRLYALAAELDCKYGDAEYHLRRAKNTELRAELRKHRKTKAGIAEKKERRKADEAALRLRHRVEDCTKAMGQHSLVPGTWQHRWINGLFVPVLPRGSHSFTWQQLANIIEREDEGDRDVPDAD